LHRLDDISRRRLAVELKRFAEAVSDSMESKGADRPVDTAE
jgi:hypothetical protein